MAERARDYTHPPGIGDATRQMMLRDGFKLAGAGALINSALYLTLVFAAAAMYGKRLVMVLAMLSAGVTFLGYVGQIASLGDASAGVKLVAQRLVSGLVLASIVIAAAAGLLLAVELLAR